MLKLVQIPGLEDQEANEWKVRALVVCGKDPVRSALARWSREHPAGYKAIMKVMRMAAQTERVTNPKHVKRSSNPAHGQVYEMLGYTTVCRLMFFYDERREHCIVCTNDYEKGRGQQDAAFGRCAELKALYERHDL